MRQRREYLRLTQPQVADHIGVSRSSYTKYESGETEISTTRLQQIALVLKCLPSYLLGEDGAAMTDTEVFLRDIPAEAAENLRAQVFAVWCRYHPQGAENA